MLEATPLPSLSYLTTANIGDFLFKICLMFVSYLFPSFSWLLLPSANFETNIYQVQLDGRVGLRSYEEKL